MTVRKLLDTLVHNDALNFALTNRIPRRFLTSVVGRVSKSENPVVARAALRIWQTFADLDLSEARSRSFKSLHACFIRELREGVRPVETSPAVLTSPCDGIVVAHGDIDGETLLQVKGKTYTLSEIAGGADLARYRNGHYVTLRLTSTMYHRFHAPYDGMVRNVRYLPGDVWNVNPPALARVDKLYCRNERALIDFELSDGRRVAIVPVAAILVAGLKLHFLQFSRTLTAADYACAAPFTKGQEMGWFEHGSTIIVLAEPGWAMAPAVALNARLRMGQALLTRSVEAVSHHQN